MTLYGVTNWLRECDKKGVHTRLYLKATQFIKINVKTKLTLDGQSTMKAGHGFLACVLWRSWKCKNKRRWCRVDVRMNTCPSFYRPVSQSADDPPMSANWPLRLAEQIAVKWEGCHSGESAFLTSDSKTTGRLGTAQRLTNTGLDQR